LRQRILPAHHEIQLFIFYCARKEKRNNSAANKVLLCSLMKYKTQCVAEGKGFAMFFERLSAQSLK
jgi:hypothetical protein